MNLLCCPLRELENISFIFLRFRSRPAKIGKKRSLIFIYSKYIFILKASRVAKWLRGWTQQFIFRRCVSSNPTWTNSFFITFYLFTFIFMLSIAFFIEHNHFWHYIIINNWKKIEKTFATSGIWTHINLGKSNFYYALLWIMTVVQGQRGRGLGG